MKGTGWVRRAPRRGRRRLVRVQPVIAEEDGAVPAVARLHAVAEGDQVFVGIDDRALRRLSGTRVVPALVEGHPAPPEFIASTDLWPCQSTAHSVFLGLSLPALGSEPARDRVPPWGSPAPDASITRPTAGGQATGVAAGRQGGAYVQIERRAVKLGHRGASPPTPDAHARATHRNDARSMDA